MRKLFITLIFILTLSFGLFAKDYIHYGFNVKCAKCTEYHEKNAGYKINLAWRTHEYKKENGKIYAKYKCCGGCVYWAEIR